MDPPAEYTWSSVAATNRSWREVLGDPGEDRDLWGSTYESIVFFGITEGLVPTEVGTSIFQARFEPMRLALRLAFGRPAGEIRDRIEMMSPTMAYACLFGALVTLPRAVVHLEPAVSSNLAAASSQDRAVPDHLADTNGGRQLAGLWAAAMAHMDDVEAFQGRTMATPVAPVDVHDALGAAVHRLGFAVSSMLEQGLDPVGDRFEGMDWI